MIQLIRTASSPQQKLDWFLPACQIRWQTRPVREPSSWNKTIIVDPCLKKEKCDDNSDIFNNMAKSPVSLLNVQQTRRGSGSQKSKLLLQRICRHSWKIRIKNKRQKCMSRKWGKLIFFITKIDIPENLPQYSGQMIKIQLLDQITNSTNSCGALVACCVLHHGIGFSLYAFWKVVKIQFLGSELKCKNIWSLQCPCHVQHRVISLSLYPCLQAIGWTWQHLLCQLHHLLCCKNSDSTCLFR